MPLSSRLCVAFLLLSGTASGHFASAEENSAIQGMRKKCVTNREAAACQSAIDYYDAHGQPADVAVVAKVLCEIDSSNCTPYVLTADVRRTDYWHWPEKTKAPLLQKVGLAPEEMVSFLQFDNKLAGYAEIPRSLAKEPTTFVVDLKRALAELPAPIVEALNPGLVGIFLVGNLGTTAYHSFVFGPDHSPVASFIALDPSLLEKSANEWATWKDNTPFKGVGDISISTTIETASNNTRSNAIQFVLLHEMGHALGVARAAYPESFVEVTQEALDQFPFSHLAWLERGGKFISKFDGDMPGRAQVKFYASPRQQVARSQALDLYRALQKTNFPTLYSATKPGDDFAESFATYVHTVVLHKPYGVEIKKAGKVITTLGACWTEPRCAQKRKLLEGIIQQVEEPKNQSSGS